MSNERAPFHRHPVFRFLVVGGTNTVATGALVVALSYLIPGWLAFTIAFVLGLIFSVLVTGRWVFDSHLNTSRALLFGAAYVAIYLVGVAVIYLLQAFALPPWANGLSVVVTAPLSFVVGRTIFVPRSQRPEPQTGSASSKERSA